jgi:hypothetical protein
MSVRKEVVKFNGLDMNIKLSLGSNLNQVGKQQAIDSLTQSIGESLINPIVDGEVRRFRYLAEEGVMNLNFFFYSSGQHFNTFTAAGFTDTETSNLNLKVLNSFYILDFYDSYDTYTQTKIFTTYLTKILDGIIEGKPKYAIQSSYDLNQFYYWNIPQSFINQQTGSTVIAYVKFSFFNAKTGKIVVFYNKDNDDNIVIRKTPEKMYFKVRLDLINRTWEILTQSFNLDYNVNAYELPPSTYVDRVNSTIDKFDDKQQKYPSGNTFNSKFGNYSII